MIIFFQEILMQLFLWLLKLIDGIMEIFSAIAGIADVTYQGRQVNILDLLISNSSVGTVFWCVLILAVGLTCIFAIVGLIKNMIANNRQVSGIMGKFFLALLGTLAMLVVVILGVLISNALLKLVSEVFQLGGDTKLSTALFNACVGDWKKGHSIAEFNTNVSVSKIFGSYSTTLGIWPKDWKQNGMINPDTFMYLPAMIAAIGLVIALIVACVNLAKRIYEIVLLYLVMPVSMSTLPMDDGARFKIWRETFVTKIILAYGTVFSVNLFILLLPIISQIKVTGASGFANSIFYIFMLVGGAIVIPAGQNMFAKLFGTAEDSHSGHGFLRGAFYGSRMVAGAAVGAVVGAAKGGAKLGKKAFGGHGKKEDSEKFTEEKKGSDNSGGGDDGGGGDSGGSEKHSDSQSSTENNDRLENQSGSTSNEGNNDMAGVFESGNANSSSNNTDNKASSEDTSQDKTDITEGAFENGNAKKGADSTDNKAQSEKSDSPESEKLENQTTGTSSEDNNDMAGAFESGNIKSSSNSTDSNLSSEKADSEKHSDTQSSTTGADNGTVTANSDGKTSSEKADSDYYHSQSLMDSAHGSFSTADSKLTAANTEANSSSDSADNQSSIAKVETNSSTGNSGSVTSSEKADSEKHIDSQSTSGNSDSQAVTVSSGEIVTTENSDSGKFTDNQSTSGNADSQAVMATSSETVTKENADNKFSDNQPLMVNSDNATTSANSDNTSQTAGNQAAAINSIDTIATANTDSSKFTDNHSTSGNSDSQAIAVNSSDTVAMANTDNGKVTDTQATTNNSNNSVATISTDSKTTARTDIKTVSENMNNGKPANNQVTSAVNTEGKIQSGNSKTAKSEKYSDDNIQSVNTDNDETIGGEFE